ncbi:response regulator transcription factor [Thermus brockianus]|uniref:DNA-binding response regulator n=1 Tax=Thermus brockianus TaxID=56956 RepID=A0ABM7XLR2_THEBO|nr:response regulator transcription factor [Thermus brockianus]BDG17302.1 DNA-binding response regulator [Thermus brockianus]
MQVLLLEDEPHLGRAVAGALAAQGYGVRWARGLEAAREAFLEGEPDLMILDVRLPEDPDGGFRFAQEVREAGYQGPILFLTARDALEDRVLGLDLGGDDYLVKPFHLEELLARVRALLRRASAVKESRVRLGALEVDLAARAVYVGGKRVDLSLREFALLELFVLHPERVFSPEEVAEKVFGDGERVGAVKVYVHYLRQKLHPQVVRTVPGGYRLGDEP